MSEDIRNQLKAIRDKIRITKVVATRSVKGRNGDSFAGFSASWGSVQDDFGGPGADVMPTDEDDTNFARNGMTLKEARVAHYMVAMTADIAALEAAFANSAITKGFFEQASASVKANYSHLIQKAMGKSNGENIESTD
jgi:hypothetical protein